ncbi:MAG: hypothetical protein ACTMIL_11235 [Brevibacterium aurantiacum]
MSGHRLGDGLTQLTGITGECSGTDPGQGAVVGETEIGEDQRPQLVVEARTGFAVAVEVIETGQQCDVLPREVAQRPR